MNRFLLLITTVTTFSTCLLSQQINAPLSNYANQIAEPDNNQMYASKNNYETFDLKVINITQELRDNTPNPLQQHPEFGILPPDAPCVDCYELLDERTLNNRVFVRYGTNGTVKLYQQSYDNFNYVDANGWYRSKDMDLYVTPTPNLYTSLGQQNKTSIDLNSNQLSIESYGSEWNFHNNLKLYVNNNGSNQFLYNANWSNSSVGSDGAYVTDIFPGIDLEVMALQGAFKTNFVVKSSFNIPQGDYLVIEDDIDLPFNTSYDLTNTYLNNDGLLNGRIDIVDNATNSGLFNIDKGIIIDSSYTANSVENLAYAIKNNKLEYYVPLSYMNDLSRVYPIYIDPLFSTNNVVAQATIGSGLLNWGAWLDGCDYFMTVATPVEVTITDIIWDVDYRAQNGAPRADGGILFFYNGCRSPMPATNFWYCNSALGGLCTSGTGVSTFTYFSSCIPAPQCPSYNMVFQLEFFERYDFDNACGSLYIVSASDWTMTVEGRTIEEPTPPTSSNGLTICNGSSTTLTATGQYGVPPYTYSWSPGGATTQSVTVTPPNNSTTTYTCTITDACGNTAVNSVNITTQAQTLFPTPNLSYTMSPASGTPCPVTVTFNTNIGTSYSGGPENYSWLFPGASSVSPGGTTGSDNGPTYGGSGGVYTVVYNNSGTYTATIDMTDGSDCASNSVTFNICVLPVTFVSFDATNVENDKVKLEWATASEINNDYFTVERSKDGINFEPVLEVGGNGNSNIMNYYEAVDENPFEGLSYYRLKQTDFNSAYDYSDVVTVEIAKSIGELSLYPNPITNKTQLSFASAYNTNVTVAIMEITGKRIKEFSYETMRGENELQINLESLANGMYFLSVSNNSGIVKSIKFVKE